MSAAIFRGDAGEVLRQASAVVGRPVTLWEVTGVHEAVPRATSDPHPSAHLPSFDLDATLRRWKIPVPVGSLWVAAPGSSAEGWVVAPVRSQPPAPPPGGRERRSRERLTLELAGLALGLIENPVGETRTSPSFAAAAALPEATNPLAVARAGLQLSMESIGRWVDLAADRRLALLDDLGQVLDAIDRASEFLRSIKDRPAGAPARAERFDAIRVVRSCLTLERRLLRDRGIELEFATVLDATFLKGDPNSLFDLLVNLVRGVADNAAQGPSAVQVQLGMEGKDLELVVRGGGALSLASIAKVRSVAEGMFGAVLSIEAAGAGSTCTVVLPLPPQRQAHPR